MKMIGSIHQHRLCDGVINLEIHFTPLSICLAVENLKISLQIWVFQIMDEWIKNNMEMEKCQFLLHIPPVQLLLWCVKWELSGS